ncbi:uncharacterized protein LOC133726207 [Rosa rugosa]|uniref:uncharacterized protein LOC133726207 n=1 Tax=Rosa rugosa TaxID=74645 RepID=UPI002B40182C|nr:uncharacterized protein LOC133726207 [Rosa rugosa]
MAGAAPDGIPFLSLRTGSDESPPHQPLNGSIPSPIGDLNLPPADETQRLRQELEQFRKEKRDREARRRRRLERFLQLDSDSSDDDAIGDLHQANNVTANAGASGVIGGISGGPLVEGVGGTSNGGQNGGAGLDQSKRARNESWRGKMEKMIDACRRTGPRELAAEIARDVGKSPFSDDILNTAKPRRFTTPVFHKYDGTTDPVDHIKGYKQQMSIETTDEKLMCKIFPSSLTGPASTWFQDLKPHSIPDFDTLSRAFISQYFCNRKQKKDMATLFSTKQKPGEKVGKFFERFKAEMRHVNCDPQFAAIAFREGLLLGTPLYESLLRDPPKDMDDIITRVEGEIRIERAKEAREARHVRVVTSGEDRRQNRGNYPDGRPDNRRQYEAKPRARQPKEWFTLSPTAIFRKHQHEGLFTKPPPQPESRDAFERAKYCPLHEAFGHGLPKCEALRPAISELIKTGKLREYQSDDQANGGRATDRVESKTSKQGTEPIIREILAIHGAPYTAVEEEVRLRSETRQAEKIRRVCQITGSPSAGQSASPTPVISFSAADTVGIQFPHRDALIVSTQIADALVRRIMVDAGSSADVIFWEAFEQLGLDKTLIHPSRAPLTAFEGSETWPVGEISLPVTTGGKTVEVDFVIVKKPSAYNVILGRDWHHRMGAEASTRCQVLKFISNDGQQVISVRGDQLLSKKLYAMEIKRSPPSNKGEEGPSA